MQNKFWAIATLLMIMYVVTPYRSIDPSIEPYYNAYMKEIHKDCHYPQYYSPGQTFITLTHLKATEQVCDESGKCVTRMNVGNCIKRLNRIEIDFDKETWATLTESDKYKFVSHEMSHCILGLGHSNDRADLMYPVHIVTAYPEVQLEVERAVKSVCR